MTASIPERLRLDNAANIYPASMSKHYSSLYRMRVTMTEDIDTEILQAALVAAARRIPTFLCTLKAGTFWWYLDRTGKDPQLLPLRSLRRFNFAEQGGLLYRVSAEGRQIFLDVFHALTDGFGAMSFLLTLSAEYIHRRYGVTISYNDLALDVKDRPVYAEVEDSFKSVFTGRRGQLEKNVDAYHIRGAVLPNSGVKDLRLVMPVDSVMDVCRRYDCTITDLLTATMLWALQEEHRQDPARRKRSVFKVSVPVNLRPMYGSRTVRNFSSYVNLGVDIVNGYLTFPRIVKTVKAQKKRALKDTELEPKIAANVELEEMLIVRMLPLFIKHPIIDIINLLHGDRFCSQTLSNMGNVNVPAEMVPYITDLDFMLGRQRGNSGACSCVGYNGKLFFHMTRKIARDGFESEVLRQLSALGIPVETTVEGLA